MNNNRSKAELKLALRLWCVRKAIVLHRVSHWRKKKRGKGRKRCPQKVCSLVATNMATLTLMLADIQIFVAVEMYGAFLHSTRQPFCGSWKVPDRPRNASFRYCHSWRFPSPGISIYYRLTQYLFTPRKIPTKKNNYMPSATSLFL